MKLYLTLRSIPELAALPPQERRKVWNRWSYRGFMNWRTWAAVFACLVFTFAVVQLEIYLLDKFPEINPNFLLFSCSILGAILGMVFFFKVFVETVRPYLKENQHSEL